MRVVAIDDEPDLVNLLAALLEPHGVDIVATASNGADGIEAARRTDPDCALLDLAMPDKDGLEALIELHSMGTRVVILTGFAASNLAPIAVQLGASAYVEKGASGKEIAKTIQDAVAAPLPVVKADLQEQLVRRAQRLI